MPEMPQTPPHKPPPTPRHTTALISRAAAVRLGLLLLPLGAALVACYVLYRTWPVLLPLLGAGCMGLLLARLLPARLGGLRWPRVPQAVAAVLWLVYAMQIAYGWRLELGYWGSLGLVFGWPCVLTVFWALLAAWALPRYVGQQR